VIKCFRIWLGGSKSSVRKSYLQGGRRKAREAVEEGYRSDQEVVDGDEHRMRDRLVLWRAATGKRW
jgi:hypothetical protein